LDVDGGIIAVDEYLSLTLKSHPAEPAEDFKKRLIVFWSHMIRDRADEYKEVYAETSHFEPSGDRLTRKYLVATGVAKVLEVELAAAGINFESIDFNDHYSKYEATPPEWFQIPH
jgi:hypothetical protein